mgnify:CR=1 FL=1
MEIDMKVIKGHVGKKKGKTGFTVQIYSNEKKPINSKSLTIHGFEVDLIHAYIKFWFDVLAASKPKEDIKIFIDAND